MNVDRQSPGGEQSSASTVAQGPAACHAGSALLGAGAVLVWNDVTEAGRTQFYEWHDKEHIPERLAIPGFRRGRRYAKAGHSPEWLTIYEADDLGVVVSPEYLRRLNSPTPGTVRMLHDFRNTSRAVCEVVHTVGSSSGGHILALRLDLPAAQGDAMCRYLRTEVFPRAMAEIGVVACHLYAADQSASFLKTAEASTREFDVPSWVILVEMTTPDAAERVRQRIDGPALRDLGVTLRSDAAIYSLEICRLGAAATVD